MTDESKIPDKPCVDVVDELKRLHVEDAEAFISLTFHRVDGRLEPTMTVFGEGLTSEQGRKSCVQW